MGNKKQMTLIFIVINVLAIISTSLGMNETNNVVTTKQQLKGCNIFQGHWAWDSSYPLYDSASCPNIRKEYDCRTYGRRDSFYLKFRWQPDHCDIPRFDGLDFLRRMKGKKIMYIGDSVSLNHWQSLVCLLHAAVPNSNITQERVKSTIYWVFQAMYLVDIEPTKIGRVLNLNSIKGGDVWKDIDVLVFNTWLWWYRSDANQPWDYVQDGKQVLEDMDRMDAFKKGLMTWAKWADSTIDPKKNKVFFTGISPSHYHGAAWNATGVNDCSKETMPIKGSTQLGSAQPRALQVVKEVISTMSKPPYLLDITALRN